MAFLKLLLLDLWRRASNGKQIVFNSAENKVSGILVNFSEKDYNLSSNIYMSIQLVGNVFGVKY